MPLADLFRPKWQHSDWRKRLAAVETISDTELLEQIAGEDPERQVRAAAVSRISDPAALERICRAGTSDDARCAAAKKLSDPARAEIVRNGRDYNVCFPALQEITDAKALLQIAGDHHDRRVRRSAWFHLVHRWQKWEEDRRRITIPKDLLGQLERIVQTASASDSVDDVEWLAAYIDHSTAERRRLYAACSPPMLRGSGIRT